MRACVALALARAIVGGAERARDVGGDVWTTLALDEGRFKTVRSYETPAVDASARGRARMRGWFASVAATTGGMDALGEALPERARPKRDEEWRVTMKGQERVLTVTTEGRIVVGDEYDAETWFVLNGLEYDTVDEGEDVNEGEETCVAGACAASEASEPREEL